MRTKSKTLAIVGSNNQLAACWITHNALNKHATGAHSNTSAENLNIYRVYKKKLNRFEIALNFAKQLFVSGFLYI
jgi:hypothetical protein